MTDIIRTAIGFAGSRKTPSNILALMTVLARLTESYGLVVRSGGAMGCDSAAEQGVKDPSNKEIFLPWSGYNGREPGPGVHDWAKCVDTGIIAEAEAITKVNHPNWDACTRGARTLHTRNVPIVLGPYLDNPSACLVCWTQSGKAEGGTGQAIRIAEYRHIPVLNLGAYGDPRDAIADYTAFLKTIA